MRRRGSDELERVDKALGRDGEQQLERLEVLCERPHSDLTVPRTCAQSDRKSNGSVSVGVEVREGGERERTGGKGVSVGQTSDRRDPPGSANDALALGLVRVDAVGEVLNEDGLLLRYAPEGNSSTRTQSNEAPASAINNPEW